MATSEVGIRLRVSGDKQVLAALSGVEGGMGRMATAAGAARSAALALGTALAGAVSVREYVQAADAVTLLQNRLKLATGSAQAAASAYGQLFDVAQRSRVSFTELGATYATIARATKELGLGQSQLMTVTEAIGNAMTISGGSAESMNAALVQLGQGLGSGTLRGEELNSVMEQTPRLAQAIADGLGITIGQLRGYAEQGRLSAEAVTRALQSQAAVLAGEVQGATLTVGQAMTQLTNATVKTVGEIDSATGASAAMATGLQGLASAVGTVGQAFKNNETAILTGLGMLAGAGTLAGLASVTAAMGGVAGAIGIVKGAFVSLSVAAAANPVGLALLGIGAAVGGFVAYNSAVADSAAGLERRIYTLQERLKAGPSIYARDAEGLRQWQGRVREMNAELAALNRQLADKRGPQITGSVGSGDTALARAQRAEWDKAASVRAEYLAATRTASQKLGDELDKARKAFGGMVPPEVEAALRERFIKPTAAAGAAARSAVDDFARLREQLAGQLADGYAQAQAAAQGLNTAQADFLKLAGSQQWAKLTGDQRAQVAVLYESRIAQEQAADALKAHTAAQQAASQAYAQSLKPYQDAARSAQDRVAAMVQENQATALAEQLNISLARAVEMTAIARLREQQAAAMGDEGKVLAIQAEIDARQKLIDLMAGRDVREAADQLRQREAQEWERTWGQVGQSLTDALMQGGKSASQYLKDLFRTLVLRPIIAPIGEALGSLLGGPAMAGQGGGGLGGLGNLGSLQNLLNPSKIFSSFGDSLAFAADSAGQWLVNNTSGYLNQLGGKLMGNANLLGTVGSYAGGAMAGLGIGKAISGGYSAIGRTGNTAVNAGTIIGSIFGGPIGGAIGGAIGGLVNRAFGRKAPVTTGEGITGTFSSGGASVQAYQDWFSKGGWFRSDKRGTKYSAVGGELQTYLNDALGQITATTKAYAAILGQGASTIDGITQSVKISLKGLNPEQQQKAIADALKGFAGRQAQDLLGTWERVMEPVLGRRGRIVGYSERWVWHAGQYVRAGEQADDALARLATSLGTVNAMFATLGRSLLQTSLYGADAASRLVDVFGGVEAFNQSTGAYYQAMYSDTERLHNARQQLTQALGGLGYALPQTIDQYRRLVGAQNLYTDAGRATYAALVNLAPAFAEVTRATEAAQQSYQQALARWRGQTPEQALRQQFEAAGATEWGAVQRRRWGGGTYTSIARVAAQMPTTVQAFEQLVAAQDATTEAGRNARAALMQLAPAFAEAAQQARQALEQLGETIGNEVRRLRGLLVQGSGASQAALAAQFATTTAAARAGDRNALQALPGISQSLEEAARATAVTAVDVARMRAWLAASLSETMASQGLAVPALAVGTNRVPADMLAIIHEGEAVVPKAYNPAAGGQAPGQAELVRELQALRRAFEEQRAEHRAELRAVAAHTHATAQALRRAMPDGDAFQTREAASGWPQ